VSLKAHRNFSNIINNYIREYDLLIIERSGETEIISGHNIGMKYNSDISLQRICRMQNPFMWLSSIFKSSKFYIKDLFIFSNDLLDTRINSLNCLNREIIEPHNVDFKYINGSYEIIKEIEGNKINKFHLKRAIIKYISEGKRILNLEQMNCYEKPKYTTSSKKALKAKNLLDKYVSAKIAYRFGKDMETLDAATIHKWLRVDENLDVIISKKDVAAYVRKLSKKYDTVGIKRTFLTSTGKLVELQGGLYGWKIDRNAETEALINHIKKGDKVEKEPAYLQKAVSREGNEIGDTFIEINITKQHLWFYKNGKMIVQGPVVTGNPNRGHSTVIGVYMINYKQMNATLTGPGYEAKVTYWMPFFGNIGLHDAPWRTRFGGEIYLRNGSHGCVNAPLYLAKTVFENIEEGTPVIVYEE